ncbi:phage head-tail connector protein [Paenibacillus ehimensis]|uniref:phage head-tail connector protein n=1 Tax=Paenibacillus ehimensis TaxID=79264 RepID=UPI003D29DB61
MEPYLNKLKPLLGIALEDASKDGQLTFILETVVQEVKTYCNIKEIPSALENIVVLIAKDFYRSEQAKTNPESQPQAIQSIKRGDVQTTFAASSGGGPGTAFVQGYKGQLNAFRKLRW